MRRKYFTPTLFLFAGIAQLFAQADMKETVAMIKKNLADSKANMKRYAWIETTTTFMDGEQKSVKQNQCYYGVDGKLTKVETGGSTPKETPGGIRGKIIANKKAEMSDYVKAAIAKVQTYLPPDADKVQQIYAGGNVAIQILDPGKKFKLSFPNYNEPGDLLAISIDKVAEKIMSVDVTTSVDDPSQKVIFNITYSNLPDGTQYAGTTTLDAQTKKLKIVIENSGFKLAAGQ
jgi:hypothetical protein